MDTLLNNKKTKVKANSVAQGIRTSETDKVKEQVTPQGQRPDQQSIAPQTATAAVNQAPQQTQTPASPTPQSQPQTAPQTAPSATQTRPVAEASVRAKREQGNPAMRQASAQIDAENKEADKEAEKEAEKAVKEAEKAARKEEKRRLKEEKRARVRAKAQAIVKSNKGESDTQSTPQTQSTAPAQTAPQQSQSQQAQPQQSSAQTQTQAQTQSNAQPQAQTQSTQQTTAQPQQETKSTSQQEQGGVNEDDYTKTADELGIDDKGQQGTSQEQTQTAQTQTAQASTAASQPQQMSYVDMYKALNPEEYDDSPEAQARREKKEKRERIARSIADGINAIARIYFGSKGVGIPHDAKNDLTNAYNARQELLRKEYESKHTNWVNGLLKAQALDAQAKKNNETLAETIRHNTEMEKNNTRKTDQGNRRLDQRDWELYLKSLQVKNDKEYKDKRLEIQKMLADGQIDRWQAQTANEKLRINTASKRSGGDSDLKGLWMRYYELMDTPEGSAKIEKIIDNSNGAIKGVNIYNIRYVMSKLGVGDARSSKPQTPAPKPQNKPAANKPQPQPKQTSRPATKPQQKAQSKPKTTQKPAQKAVPRQKQDLSKRSRNL